MADGTRPKRRSTRSKLVGWGILAGAVVVIIGIFLITRALSPSTPTPPSVAAATASQSSVASASAPAQSQPSASPSSQVIASALSETPPPVSSQASAASSPKLAVVDAASMDQRARRDLLNKLIGQGVFTGVEPFGPPAKVGVMPLFQGLSPDLQQQFLAVVYAYVHNGAAATDPLQVIDATNGKVIGNFTNETGLKPA